MINTIVPRPYNENNLLELEEASEVWKVFFGPDTSEETKEGVNLSSLRSKLEKNIKHCSTERYYAASWILLEFWMDKYRKGWLDDIKRADVNLLTTKEFFNLIFRHSIENITKRLNQVSG
jgi:hypothetical protein